MRILYVLGRFPNVSNTFIISEVAGLVRKGHHVDVISLERPEEIDVSAHPEVAVHDLVSRTTYIDRTALIRTIGRSPAAMLRGAYDELWSDGDIHKRALTERIARTLRKGEHDIVHTHFAKDFAKVALAAAVDAGVPFTFTTHAFDLYDGEMKMPDGDLRTMVSRSARAITISGYNRDHIISVCGEGSAEKVEIVHCGIEPDKFPPIYEGGGTSVLTVSRLVEKKGIDVLISAAGILGAETDLTFDIVGGGPLHGKLKRQAVDMGPDGKVIFHGSVDDGTLIDLYGRALMFVLPCVTASNGDRDGIPVVLMEAMASGVPVISTDVSGIPELVVDGETGVTVPEGDDSALAEAMAGLAGDAGMRDRLGSAGRRKVASEFAIDDSVDRLIAIWQEAAG